MRGINHPKIPSTKNQPWLLGAFFLTFSMVDFWLMGLFINQVTRKKKKKTHQVTMMGESTSTAAADFFFSGARGRRGRAPFSGNTAAMASGAAKAYRPWRQTPVEQWGISPCKKRDFPRLNFSVGISSRKRLGGFQRVFFTMVFFRAWRIKMNGRWNTRFDGSSWIHYGFCRAWTKIPDESP